MAATLPTGRVPGVVHATLRSPEPAGPLLDSKRPGAAPGASFVDMLRSEVRDVNALQVTADRQAEAVVTGASADIHGTMIALAKADLSFRLLTQVRNRALEAYQEIMRMNL